jgi:uncharacterized protein
MLNVITPIVAGILFGTGLAVSGMTEPTIVLGFMDLFGQWNPTLAFVMGGAIAVTLPGFYLLQQRRAPWFASAFAWPTRRDIDRPLVMGSALFGAGWGLGGFCPGPAIAGLVTGSTAVIVFVIAMVSGMLIHDRWVAARQSTAPLAA